MRWYQPCFALASLQTAVAITLDINSQDSIKSAAKIVATRMLTYYNGGTPGQIITGVPGTLPQTPVKYYWWEMGETLMTLIDYWHLTGDSGFNDVITEALLFQVGPLANYMPPNQSRQLGNDDQVYWAFAAMGAAELNYPNPPNDQPQWLALAQAVFNTQIERWDTTTCNGGLRWQIFSFNAGWDYKNSASNMGFFNLAARLGAYTNNQTYLDWAEKSWNWQAAINLVSPDGEVFDGSDDLKNCTELDHVQWSYNAGMALHGATVMHSMTNNSKWADRANAIWNSSVPTFFPDKQIMSETACELNTPVNCNTDQLSFKASFSRFLAAAAKNLPSLAAQIQPYLAASAVAAAAQCTGQPGGDSCGTTWFKNGVWDGTTGLGQQMSALGVIQSNLFPHSDNVVSNSTGGTSIGNPSAGVGGGQPTFEYKPITVADRAGAGIVTALVLIMTASMTWFTCY